MSHLKNSCNGQGEDTLTATKQTGCSIDLIDPRVFWLGTFLKSLWNGLGFRQCIRNQSLPLFEIRYRSFTDKPLVYQSVIIS